MIKEHCGVLGADFKISSDPSKIVYNALISLQHRGQESYGIAFLEGKKVIVKKELGLVDQNFILENV
ncbi:MAG TPA: hypothetical protein VKU94_02025, partial [Geobacterales bacterium]|nr:hypothetical protein [Geobacterales bacterium]